MPPTHSQRARRKPRISTTLLCAAASTAWLYVAVCWVGFYHHDGRGDELCLALAIALGFAAVYAMLRDWMASPRGREATVAMRLGIRIGRIRGR